MDVETWQVAFVDSIAASPVIRLNLAGGTRGPWNLRDGSRFDPPQLRRFIPQTLMTDGGEPAAAAYDNRTIVLQLQPMTGGTIMDAEGAAAQMQLLMRELNRQNNILRFQPGTAAPVFFLTYRAGPDSVDFNPVNREITVTLLAAPLGLGLKETIGSITVNEDPAAGSNPMYFDLTGIKGDVETPVNLVLPTGNLYDSGDPISVLATRRRGLTSLPFVLQAETGTTLGTDTTLPGNDAAMSGTGSNYARCSFGTNTSMVRRVYLDPYPTSASTDNRGTYRAFLCTRRSSASGVVNVQLGYTSGTAGINVVNDPVAVPLVTARQHVDLGLISYPTGLDPVYDGYSGVEYPVRGRYLEVRAERVSGSSTLDFDYLLFVPADDQLALIDWGDAILTTNEFVVDSVHEIVFTQNTPQDQVYGSKPTAVAGGFPTVAPGVTNRMFFIRRTGRGATVTKSETTAFEAQYWPRYLTVRPATT